MPTRPCLSCGTLTTRTDSRCPTCASARGKARDQARGNRHARGLGAEHDRLRERWRPLVERGGVHCHAVVCLMPTRLILAGQEWHLDHNDDRTGYRGPAHALCNTSAGGRASHRTQELPDS